MPKTALPRSVSVIVRDWLNSNQVVITSPDCAVVVDSGYGRDTIQTLDLLATHQSLRSRKVDWLVNTHCHSDHMGANASVRRAHGCRLSIPEGEASLIRLWDERALWLSYTDQRCEIFQFDDVIRAGQQFSWGGLDWLAIAAPGHDMHALMFHCPQEGILISGDALWEHGFGLLLPGPDSKVRLSAARATLDTIAALEVKTVIPGHGRPFPGVNAALGRAYARLEALAADELRMVRTLLKTMFMFSLLDHRRMAVAEVPAYLARVPLYHEYNAMYLSLPFEELAAMIVADLERAGAVRQVSEQLLPREQ